MVDVLLIQPDGTVITQPDGPSVAAYTFSTAVPEPPAYSIGDYQAALLALLPSGPVWPKDDGSVLSRVMGEVARGFARLGSRAAALLQEAPAGYLLELLPEWEATLGLPDPCTRVLQDVPTRQRAVRGRIAARGGQSVPYVVALAAALGLTITVQEFAPSYCDDALGGPLGGEEWAHCWRVVIAPQPDTAWDATAQAWFSTAVECAIRRMAPAQTRVVFIYQAPLGGMILGRDSLAA